MSSFTKFVVVALTALSGVAASAHTAEPRTLAPVLPVVSAHGNAVSLSAVHDTGRRHHHHRRHRAHPVRPAR